MKEFTDYYCVKCKKKLNGLPFGGFSGGEKVCANKKCSRFGLATYAYIIDGEITRMGVGKAIKIARKENANS
jgi:hypothetical protein